MPDDGISPCADDRLVGQLAGILCLMVKAGKLKHLDSCRPKLSVQVCGVSRDPVRVNTALLTDEGVVSTVFCGKCASTLGLEEQERHRRLEPGVSTRQNLVNLTGGDHGPVREINGKGPYRQHACHRGAATTHVRQAACPQLPAHGSGRVASGAIDEQDAAVGTALCPVCGLDGTNRSESAQLGVHKGANRSHQMSSRRRHAVF
jgi:hypothetical protein